MSISRRTALRFGAAALLAPAAPRLAAAAEGPFSLPPLPYDPAALEPHIDAKTMAIHHGRHHAGYVRGVNKALADHSQLHGLSIQALVGKLGELPERVRMAVRNAGGGHANHSMFWSIMSAQGGGAPSGALAAAVTRDFGSFDAFKTAFETAGKKRFGSGWVFVTADASGKLAVLSKPNQDTPNMDGLSVLMGNDVWEHAYYLTYQNKRGDYLAAWWNTVDWAAVAERYAKIQGGALL